MEDNKATDQGRMLTGMFSNRESTENAYKKLHERGYTKDDINLVMSDKTREKHFSKGESEVGNKALEGGLASTSQPFF